MPDHSMIDSAEASQAVLSQNSLEHLDNLYATHRASLDQADQHAHILHHERLPTGRTVLDRRGAGRASRGTPLPLRLAPSALGIECALLVLAHRITVIGDTTHSGLLLAVSCPAAKGTTQVFATGITPMTQEEDPAMPAAGQTAA